MNLPMKSESTVDSLVSETFNFKMKIPDDSFTVENQGKVN